MANIPLELRLAGLFLVGILVGSLINLGVYRLAWNPRWISPWSRAPEGAPPRRWSDRIPVLGWLGLRREAAIHGGGFWVRPMIVELFAGAGFAALYWWEVARQGLFLAPQPLPELQLHLQYACHLLLMSLMLMASLIDTDEKIIPDAITVTGTWLGLLAAAVYPLSMLPNLIVNIGAPPQPGFLHLWAPNDWPVWLDGRPLVDSLVLGLGCWWLWCVALMRRTWYGRHGWRRALNLAVARLKRDRSTMPIVLMGLVGSGAIAGVWYWGGDHWRGLLTALVGMVAGGLVIWLVRVIGTVVLRREAMGFGDVTLMAMIGAFLGWQACLLIFFLAPFAGLVVGLITLMLRQEHEIPYGPFLCLAAAGVIIKWAPVWDWASSIFALGLLIPAVMLVCMVLMALLLGVWRLILAAIG